MNNRLVKMGLITLLGLTLLSCRTKIKTVEVERLKTEYQDRYFFQRDSVYLHDSIYVEHKGDTIYRDRWHTRYKELIKHDTAYIDRRDSISYPVVVEVEKPRPWLERIEINAYRLVFLLILIYAGWHSIRKLLWRRKL